MAATLNGTIANVRGGILLGSRLASFASAALAALSASVISVARRATGLLAQAMAAQDAGGRAQAETALSQALGSLFAVAEAYPDLKASANFLALQQTLAGVEDEIALARRYYNAVVRNNNIKCESFPSVLVAGLFHFGKRDFFQAGDDERAAVRVDF